MAPINDTLHLENTSVPQSLRKAYATARQYGLANTELTLRVTIAYFTHDYKHVGLDIDQESSPTSPWRMKRRTRLREVKYTTHRKPDVAK